jgi:hypothetical protein
MLCHWCLNIDYWGCSGGLVWSLGYVGLFDHYLSIQRLNVITWAYRGWMSLPEHTEAECHYLSIQRLNVIIWAYRGWMSLPEHTEAECLS